MAGTDYLYSFRVESLSEAGKYKISEKDSDQHFTGYSAVVEGEFGVVEAFTAYLTHRRGIHVDLEAPCDDRKLGFVHRERGVMTVLRQIADTHNALAMTEKGLNGLLTIARRMDAPRVPELVVKA